MRRSNVIEFHDISTEGHRMPNVKSTIVDILVKKKMLTTCSNCYDYHPEKGVDWDKIKAEVHRLKMN